MISFWFLWSFGLSLFNAGCAVLSSVCVCVWNSWHECICLQHLKSDSSSLGNWIFFVAQNSSVKVFIKLVVRPGLSCVLVLPRIFFPSICTMQCLLVLCPQMVIYFVQHLFDSWPTNRKDDGFRRFLCELEIVLRQRVTVAEHGLGVTFVMLACFGRFSFCDTLESKDQFSLLPRCSFFSLWDLWAFLGNWTLEKKTRSAPDLLDTRNCSEHQCMREFRLSDLWALVAFVRPLDWSAPHKTILLLEMRRLLRPIKFTLFAEVRV